MVQSQVDGSVMESVGQDELRTALLAEDPNGNLVKVQVDSNGEISAELSDESVGLAADDDDGNTLNPQAETLSETISDPDGLVTYLSRALQQYGQDEIRMRVFDSSGTAVDPATAALEDALKNNDNDEFVVRLTGADGVEIAEESLDTAIAGTDTGIVTYMSAALNSVGQDELVSRVAGTDGVQIAEEQLDTAAASTDAALITYLSRALNTIGQDELVARLADSAGNQIDPKQGDAAQTKETGQAIDTTGQIASLNTEGRDTVTLGIDASQGDATYRIDASHDGTNWIEGFATYDPAVGDSTDTVRDSLSIGASHIRVFVSGASGTAGATADVLLGASG